MCCCFTTRRGCVSGRGRVGLRGGSWVLYLTLEIIQSTNPLLSLFFLTPALLCHQKETESIWRHKSSCQTQRSTFQIESEASANACRWCFWCQLCWNLLPLLETLPSWSPLLALSLCAVIAEAGIHLFLFICYLWSFFFFFFPNTHILLECVLQRIIYTPI